MSTLSVTITNGDSDAPRTATYTITYSVSSTTTSTTLSITNLALSASSWASSLTFTIVADGTTLYNVTDQTSTSLSLSKTWSKSTSAQSKTLTITVSSGSFTPGTNSAIITVPALTKYTITLNNQSATSAGTTAIYQTYNTNVYLDSSRTNAMTTSANPITVPTKTGYTFNGYYNSTSGGTQYISSSGYITSSGLSAGKAITAAATWYAQWTELTYTVTYDANGHGTAPSSQTKYYTTALTLASAITATGYSFSTWNSSADGLGTDYAAGSSYTQNVAITLYAIWNYLISDVTIGSATVVRVDNEFSTAESSSTAANAYAVGDYFLYDDALWEATDAIAVGDTLEDGVNMEAVDESDDGEYAFITVPYTVTGPAAGSVTMTITATADSGTTPTVTRVVYTDTKVLDTTLSGTFYASAATVNTDIRYTFAVTLTASNTTYQSQSSVTATKTLILPTAYYVMDVLAGGKGIHFGGAATDEGFYVSMAPHVKYDGSIAHHNDDVTNDTAPSSDTYRGLKILDSNDDTAANFYARWLTTSRTGAVMEAYNGSYNNSLYMDVDSSGNYYVSVTSPAAWRSALGVVNIAGDTMTGDLTISEAGSSTLYLKTTDGPYTSYIRAYPDSSATTYGNVMVLFTGGNMIVGAGESPNAIYSTPVDSANGTGENLYLSADSVINFYSNCNTIANRNKMTYAANGDLGLYEYSSGVVNGTATSSDVSRGVYIYDSAGNASAKFVGMWTTSSYTNARVQAQNGSYYNTLTLGVNASGARTVAVTDKLPWFKTIAGWTSLGSTTATTAKSITASSYTEILVIMKYSTSYWGSCLIPVVALSTTANEWYCGGGAKSATSGRRGVFTATTTKITPVCVTVDGTDYTSTSVVTYIYAR